MSTIISIGTELEAWMLKAQDLSPVSMSEHVQGLSAGVAAHGLYGLEPGRGSIEEVGFHGGISVASKNLLALHGRLQEFATYNQYTLRCEPVRPGTPPKIDGPEVPNQRYLTLWRACGVEIGSHKRAAHGLAAFNGWAAAQFHMSIDNIPLVSAKGMTREGLWLMNVFNFYGPEIARILCDEYRQDACHNLGNWRDWASNRRFPRPDLWFASSSELVGYFESLPRLMKPLDGKKHGDFEVDLVDTLDWQNPVDHGAGWWIFARPRPHNGCGTLEIRLLPSMEPCVFIAMLEDVEPFVTHVLSVMPEKLPTFEQFLNNKRLRKSLCRHPVTGGRRGRRLSPDYSPGDWHRDVFGQ